MRWIKLILLTLIKKEIKEFFRNKSDVIVMLIFPVILIFVMGKSLDDLMSVEKNIFNNKTIYYRINMPINNKKNLQIFYDFMINFEKKTNVKFIENKNYREEYSYLFFSASSLAMVFLPFFLFLLVFLLLPDEVIFI